MYNRKTVRICVHLCRTQKYITKDLLLRGDIESIPHSKPKKNMHVLQHTKCIQACPVDAILGAAKLMHTVIADECTGCDLCVEPCPVDCIDMLAVEEGIELWRWPAPKPAAGIIVTDRAVHIASEDAAA